MATVGDILVISARHLGVSPVSQSPTGADYLVLEAEYNGLMHELSANFDLLNTAGAAYTHTDQTTGDTFALGDRFVTGMAAMVAERAAGQIGNGSLHTNVSASAGRGYGLICGAFQKAVVQDQGMLRRNGFYT